MKKSFILVLGFFVFLIISIGCHTHISFHEEAIKEIHLGKKIFYLNSIIGRERSKDSVLIAPISMAVDTNRNIYIVDGKKLGLIQYSSSGDFVKRIVLKTESERLFRPIALEIDPKGNLILMDVHIKRRWRKRIHIISPRGDILLTKKLPHDFSYFTYCKDSLFFTVYGDQRSKLVFKTPILGSNSLEFGEMYSTNNPQLHYIRNQVSICSEGNKYILLSYTFLPRVCIFSSDGKLIRAFEFEANIKNKKDPLNFISPIMPERIVGGVGIAEFNFEAYPVCYDITVEGQNNIYLLMAADHSKPEKKAIFRFDFSGNLLDKAILPFSCNKIFVDAFGNFYFLGAEGGKFVLKYKSM